MDHLSSTILMCAILLLFYATGTVKGVAFDAGCAVNGDCTDDNNKCSATTNGKCECTDASYRNTPNDACVTKIGINGTCISTDSSTEQCSKDNSECSSDGASGHRCFCTSAYYGESTTCTPRKKPTEDCALYQCIANAMCSATGPKCACNTGYKATTTANPTCEIVAFGDSCTTAIVCGEDNNVCTASECKCSGTSFRNKDNDACVTKVAVNGTCISTETSSDQCSDANAACNNGGGTEHRCFCTSAHFDLSGTCTERLALGDTCSTSGASNQCADDNAECPSGATCTCKSTHYKESSTCKARKSPDVPCEANQCVANAVCNTTDDKCDCNMGYRATTTSTPTCEIVAFGAACTIDSDCGEDNNVCSNSTCVCSDTSSRKGNACVISSDAATIMLAHMHVFIFGTVASLYFLL